jgi:hypothetical protein
LALAARCQAIGRYTWHMDNAALIESPMGAVVPISGTDPLNGRRFEHFAFVPAPLPSQVALASSTWKQVVAAEAALGPTGSNSATVPGDGAAATPGA